MAAEDSSLKAVQVKLVLLGEAAVGKSSLVLRFVHNDFNENTSPTIGAAFLTQKCRLENRVVKFEIWDTAGQERFMSLAPMYYRNSAASVVVYDITKTSSFEKAKAWVKELKRQANPNIVIALVGNKLDLVEGSDGETAPKDDSAVETPAAAADEGADDDDATPPPPSPPPAAADGPRQVSTAEAKAYADENGLLFFEASAKTGTNVQNIFIDLAKTIPFETVAAKPAAGAAHGRRSAANAAANDSGRVQLGDEPVAKKGGCC